MPAPKSPVPTKKARVAAKKRAAKKPLGVKIDKTTEKAAAAENAAPIAAENAPKPRKPRPYVGKKGSSLTREAQETQVEYPILRRGASNRLQINYGDGQGFVEVKEDAIEVQKILAKRELARRTLARRRLIHMVQYFNPNYQAGAVHELIARELETFMRAVQERKSPRLMIMMPPRHGKSELASRYYPSFHLGHNPSHEIIAASYGMSLAEKFSRTVRGIVETEQYGLLFPEARVDPDNRALEDWGLLAQAGGYRPAGARVGITGMGAHVLIIDDPIRDQKDADSDTIRDDLWDWYTTTASTRLAPGGGVLLIQTCWHDDDLAGRLQEQIRIDAEEGNTDQPPWRMIRFPALADKDEYLNADGLLTHDPAEGVSLFRRAGEALHADRYPVETLKSMRRLMHPRHWNALYQQNPVPDDGEFFSRDQFRTLLMDPSVLYAGQAYIAVDFAITEKQESDYTVVVEGFLMPDDTLHVENINRFRTQDTDRMVGAIAAAVKRCQFANPVLGVEDGQIWKAVEKLLRKKLRAERLHVPIEVLKPLTDKKARATPLQGRMQQHMVTFKQDAPWLEAAISEMLRFPRGVHDDIVDALAWLAQLVLGKEPPQQRVAVKRRGEKPWRDKLRHMTAPGKSPMSA